MKNKLRKLVKLKKLLIKHFGKNINNVILFGSQITDKAHDDSDYDLLIILANKYDWNYKDKVLDVCYDFSIDHNIFLDIKIISLHELNNSLRGKQSLFVDAIKEGVYL